jgi:collagenase-like PrtC family protease
MSYTATDLAKLRAAIAKGAQNVRIGDEEVTFRSLKEMMQIESKMVADLAGVSASARPTHVNAGFDRGF